MRKPYGEHCAVDCVCPALLSILRTAIVAIVNLPRHILDTATSSENAVGFHPGGKARTQPAVHGFEYETCLRCVISISPVVAFTRNSCNQEPPGTRRDEPKPFRAEWQLSMIGLISLAEQSVFYTS